MWIVLRYGTLEVEVSAEGTYAPDVMDDLCTRAKDLFTYEHALLGTTAEADE